MVIPKTLPHIVVIINELADLMLVAPADTEMAISRITQMGRAAGIHCVVATHQPNVSVITGIIKNNIPARIALQVGDSAGSRTLLDAMGAERLRGKGDLLYLAAGSAKLLRGRGVLITDRELLRVVEFITRQRKTKYDKEMHALLSQPIDEEEFEKSVREVMAGVARHVPYLPHQTGRQRRATSGRARGKKKKPSRRKAR